MMYSIDFFIERRKKRWNEHKDIEKDREFRKVLATEIVENKDYIEQIKEKPERMIELFFVLVDKNQKTLPFFINSVQKRFLDKLNQAIEDYNTGKIISISFLVLKGRQLGFTTLITAYQLACSLTQRNFQGFTVADNTENTQAIFQNKAKYPYEDLPEELKATTKFNNVKELLFDKLNSSWSVKSATKNMGRSRTINFFHGSECAFWEYGISATQAGIGEAFTPNCIKIYESTANGFNDFATMWESNAHINCFFEWWLADEYEIEFKDNKEKEKFLNSIETNKEWIFTRLKWLKEEKGLKLEKLNWYYNKYQNYIEKELIKQEYPCFPEEAFLSTGACYFDKEKILERIKELENIKPIKVGYFKYNICAKKDRNLKDYLTVENIEWVEDSNGFIKIYEDVKSHVPYVLGGDTAGEGSDFFTGDVINNITGKQVAVLKKEFDEIEYTIQMYCLGFYYNQALIGIENNYSTYPTNKLDELQYKKLYVREKEDDFTERTKDAFGFKTTAITRPLILANLQQIISNEIDKIVDIETLKEMLKFIKNSKKKGRPEAENGFHDDLVMSLAITYFIRTQQSFKFIEEKTIIKSEYVQENYNGFNLRSRKRNFTSGEGVREIVV